MWLFIVTTQRLKQTVLLPDFFFEKPIDQFAFAKNMEFFPSSSKNIIIEAIQSRNWVPHGGRNFPILASFFRGKKEEVGKC